MDDCLRNSNKGNKAIMKWARKTPWRWDQSVMGGREERGKGKVWRFVQLGSSFQGHFRFSFEIKWGNSIELWGIIASNIHIKTLSRLIFRLTWDKVPVSFPRKQPPRGRSAGMTSTEEHWQEHLWGKQDWAEESFQMPEGLSKDLCWSQDVVDLGCPCWIGSDWWCKSTPGGGICLEKAATFGWGKILGRDLVVTCQQAIFSQIWRWPYHCEGETWAGHNSTHSNA